MSWCCSTTPTRTPAPSGACCRPRGCRCTRWSSTRASRSRRSNDFDVMVAMGGPSTYGRRRAPLARRREGGHPALGGRAGPPFPRRLPRAPAAGRRHGREVGADGRARDRRARHRADARGERPTPSSATLPGRRARAPVARAEVVKPPPGAAVLASNDHARSRRCASGPGLVGCSSTSRWARPRCPVGDASPSTSAPRPSTSAVADALQADVQRHSAPWRAAAETSSWLPRRHPRGTVPAVTTSGPWDRDGPAPFPRGCPRRSTAPWPGSTRRGYRTVLLGLVDAGGYARSDSTARPRPRAFESGWSFIDAIQWWGPDDTGAPDAVARLAPGPGRARLGSPVPVRPTLRLFFAEFEEPLRDAVGPLPAGAPRRACRWRRGSTPGWDGSSSASCSKVANRVRRPPRGRSGPAGPPAAMAQPVLVRPHAGGRGRDLAQLGVTLNRGASQSTTCAPNSARAASRWRLAPARPARVGRLRRAGQALHQAPSRRPGRQATFMAQLGPGFPGLGGHPSLSLHSPSTARRSSRRAGRAVEDRRLPPSRASWRCCPSSWCWSPRTPTPTAASAPGTGRPLPRRGESATTAARCVPCSATRAPPGWSCGSPAPTSIRTTAWPCCSGPRAGESSSASNRRRPWSPPTTGGDDTAAAPLPRDLVAAADRFEASSGRSRAVRRRVRRAPGRVRPGRGGRLSSLRAPTSERDRGIPRRHDLRRDRRSGVRATFEFELSDEQAETFDRDGFVVVERLVDPEPGRGRPWPATRTCSPGGSRRACTPTSGTGVPA